MLSVGVSVGAVATLMRRGGSAPPPPPPSNIAFPANSVAVWLILGQSNALGYAPWRQDPAQGDPALAVDGLTPAERDTHPWLRFSTKGAGANAGKFTPHGVATDATPRTSTKFWDASSMGVDRGIPLDTASFGPEIGLVRHVLAGGAATEWRDDANPRLFVFKQADGGRSVDHFRWGGPGQAWVLDALRQTGGENLTSLAAAHQVLLQGVIYVIGERDSTNADPSGATMANSLDDRFGDWVRQIRAALGIDVPVAFVEINDAIDARKQTANAKLATLAAGLTNAAVIPRQPTWTNVGDNIHYDAAGQGVIGAEVFGHFRDVYGRAGDGLVMNFPFTGLKPWFHVPPMFTDDAGGSMKVAAIPAVSGKIYGLVTAAGAATPTAVAIRDAAGTATGFVRSVTADAQSHWLTPSGAFVANLTQDCHFVLEDSSGALGEAVTLRRTANAKFAPDLKLESNAGGAAQLTLKPKFSGTVNWALHAGARNFMRPEDVENAAFTPLDAATVTAQNNVLLTIDLTGLTSGAQYTLLATGAKGAGARTVTQSVTWTAA